MRSLPSFVAFNVGHKPVEDEVAIAAREWRGRMAGTTLETRWAARALSGRWLAKGADEETELDVVRDLSHTCCAGTSRKRLRR